MGQEQAKQSTVPKHHHRHHHPENDTSNSQYEAILFERLKRFQEKHVPTTASSVIRKETLFHYLKEVDDELARNVVDSLQCDVISQRELSKLVSCLDSSSTAKINVFCFEIFARGGTLSAENARRLVTCAYRAALKSASVSAGSAAESNRIIDALVRSLCPQSGETSREAFVDWCEDNFPQLCIGIHQLIARRVSSDSESATSTSTPFAEATFPDPVLGWVLGSSLPLTFFPAKESELSVNRLQSLLCYQKWDRLFDSDNDGLSKNRFEHHVFAYRAPTVCLVYTRKAAFCFGLDGEWRENASKYGGSSSTLIQLEPEFRVVSQGSSILYYNMSSRSGVQQWQIATRLTISKEFSTLSFTPDIANDVLDRIVVWGCGGLDSLHAQKDLKSRELRDAVRNQNVPKGALSDNPDAVLLDLAGAHKSYVVRYEEDK